MMSDFPATYGAAADLNASSLSPANNTHSFVNTSNLQGGRPDSNPDYSQLTVSPNQERLKKLCNKLAGLGTNIEEEKLVSNKSLY